MVDVKVIDEKEEKLKSKIMVSLGKASMCWTEVEKAGIFKSGEAIKIGNLLFEDLKRLIE